MKIMLIRRKFIVGILGTVMYRSTRTSNVYYVNLARKIVNCLCIHDDIPCSNHIIYNAIILSFKSDAVLLILLILLFLKPTRLLLLCQSIKFK